MRLKSYYAGTVEAAIELASKELGPDAWLVDSRPAPPEAARPGEFEVTFGWDAEPESAAPGAAAEGGAPWEMVWREIAELRRRIEAATAEARRRGAPVAGGNWGERDAELGRLLEWGLSEAAAGEILDRLRRRADYAGPARGRPGGWDGDWMENAVKEELPGMLRVARLPTGEREAPVAALVGPPGAGKTTTLVKLAVRYGVQVRRPVQILTLDTQRIAAAEQLRRFAAILGAGFQTLDTPHGLAQSIEEHRSKGLVLVDTPGVSCGDGELESDLRQALLKLPEIDVHLVLPANLNHADMERILDRFGRLGVKKLVFTHLDETTSAGAMISEAVRTGLPVAYLCDGQRVPEDLHEADAADLASRLFEHRMAGAAAA